MNIRFKMITLIIVLVLPLQMVTIAEVQKYTEALKQNNRRNFLAENGVISGTRREI